MFTAQGRSPSVTLDSPLSEAASMNQRSKMLQRKAHEDDDNDIEKEPVLEWQTPNKSTWQQYKWSCSVVLAALTLSTAGFVFMYHINNNAAPSIGLPVTTKLAGEVNSLVPDCKYLAHGWDLLAHNHAVPLSPQVWSNNSMYGPEEDIRDLPQEEIEQLMKRWKALLPRGYGFVPVHKPEKHTLPPPLQYEGLPPPDYYYSISAFHQLHCLNAILQTFVTDRTGFSHGAHERRAEVHFHHSRHILHCFDYLRQAIMCYGDTALEGADPYSIAEGRDKVLIGTSGIGTTHMCKNYDELVKYAEEHANPKWMRPSKEDA